MIKQKNFKAILLILLGFAAGAVSAGVYMRYIGMYNANGVVNKVTAVEHVLNNEYLYEYDKDEIADYAAYGMVAALEDPYTSYFTKEQFSAYTDDGNGDFVGIGVTVVADPDAGTITIESVTQESPAEKAGVKAGDVLTKVNGTAYSVLEFSEAVAEVRGIYEEGEAEGKTVTITVLRDGREQDIEIVRERMHTNSVDFEMIEDNIGYIKISSFNRGENGNDDTYQEFSKAYASLVSQGMNSLIIDVRNNGGGDLEAVSSILDMMIPEGVLMYTEDKNGEREYLYSDKNETNIPMAVLVNGRSASASELLTGGLKDYEKAVVIGEKTYGKGVMQRVYPLNDGSGITVTVAKYFTPKGTCVQDTGIEPDYIVEQANDKPISELTRQEDAQLTRAVEILKDNR